MNMFFFVLLSPFYIVLFVPIILAVATSQIPLTRRISDEKTRHFAQKISKIALRGFAIINFALFFAAHVTPTPGGMGDIMRLGFWWWITTITAEMAFSRFDFYILDWYHYWVISLFIIAPLLVLVLAKKASAKWKLLAFTKIFYSIFLIMWSLLFLGVAIVDFAVGGL
ncbi:MAG: hypothetical protein FWG66_14580 [Spirochaetes bacterium]|nr:hypothetical protein [Spirochaetota bacterium]